ncbi:hypothetical protein LL14B4_10085 [Lactococcus lactis subsp. lactis]|uniref:Uncharacterized protein n=1 Tax=Lactococcus lactis subsp. lactis TaxID=1360 RepID=A0A2Z3KFM0_LACLL|nr:hypothetical protein [Lactococcus lactis]AWN66502.1 hypothetical protein LL14B4_10085 [Lactococcus lactis subsp. lactis]
MGKTLYDIYFNREQNRMVRCEVDDEKFSRDEIPDSPFFKTYKEGYFLLGDAYGWEYVKMLLITESVENDLINTVQYDDHVYRLSETDALKLIRSICKILEPEVLRKVDLDFPDDYVKTLWNESEIFDISTHSSEVKKSNIESKTNQILERLSKREVVLLEEYFNKKKN